MLFAHFYYLWFNCYETRIVYVKSILIYTYIYIDLKEKSSLLDKRKK